MNNQELNDVLRKSSSPTNEEVLEQVAEPQVVEEVVTETPAPASQGEETEEQTPEESSPPSEPTESIEAVDEFGVPWKNRAMERERKAQQLIESIPHVIEETLSKQNEQKEQTPKYTIEQLEAYALQNPEERPWVEQQKEQIREERLEARLREIRESERQAITIKQKKEQAETAVLSDPRYSEAFVVDSTGKKHWNQNSELAHLIHGYMQDPRVSGQPEGLLIAARLARADYLDKMTPEQLQKITALKRKNSKLKQATQVEGGGVSHQQVKTDAYQSAKERAAKTGSKKDTQAAVLQYLKRRK